jgi:hypothetical protein
VPNSDASTEIVKLYEDLKENQQSHPDLYLQPPDPCFWNDSNGITFAHFVEAIMHLLFLGICKALLVKSLVFVGKRKKGAYLDSLDGVLESVASMTVDWCKVLPFSKEGGTGAKVSESYLVDARLMPWFMSPLEMLPDDAIYVAPPLPMERWTVVQNKQWLKAHGLSTKGKADELRTRVMDAMSRDDPVPLVNASGGSTYNLLCVIQTWHATLSRIMARTVSPSVIVDVRRHICVFLDQFHRFDTGLYEEE